MYKPIKNINLSVFIIYVRILALIVIYITNPNLIFSFLTEMSIINTTYCVGFGNTDIIDQTLSLPYDPYKQAAFESKVKLKNHLSNLNDNFEHILNLEPVEKLVKRTSLHKIDFYNVLIKKNKAFESEFFYKTYKMPNCVTKSLSLKKYIAHLNFKVDHLLILKDCSQEICIKTDVLTPIKKCHTSCLKSCTFFHDYCQNKVNEIILEKNQLMSLKRKFPFLPKKLYFYIK